MTPTESNILNKPIRIIVDYIKLGKINKQKTKNGETTYKHNS